MRQELVVKRNLENEVLLKAIIEEIEAKTGRVDESELEELYLKANELVVPERAVDETLIDQYYSWASLDDLVGELTMEVPKVNDITREELAEVINYMRDIIHDRKQLYEIDFNYFNQFYYRFFEENFANGEVAHEMVYEDVPVEKVVEEAFSSEKDDVICI